MRPVHLDDAMVAIEESQPELSQWMSWAQKVPLREEVLWLLEDGERAFEKDEAWEYFIFARDTGELAGMAGLNNARLGPRAIEVSYWVHPKLMGRGYATAAARCLVDAAFGLIPAVRVVEIRMDEANQASAAIPPKLGFELARKETSEKKAKSHTGRTLVWQRWRST